MFTSLGKSVTMVTSAIKIRRANSIDWSIFIRLAPALDRAKPCAGYSYTGQPGHTGGRYSFRSPAGLPP